TCFDPAVERRPRFSPYETDRSPIDNLELPAIFAPSAPGLPSELLRCSPPVFCLLPNTPKSGPPTVRPGVSSVKVRIKATPREDEVDGVKLDVFAAGDIRDVSSIVASWLIANGYAELEMRQKSAADDTVDRRTAAPRTHPPNHSEPHRRVSDRLK